MGEVPAKVSDATAHGQHEECEEHEQVHLRSTPSHHHLQEQLQRKAAATAFHISLPTNPISAIVAPPPLQQSSVVIDDPFQVSRILLQQADKFQVL